MQRLVFRTLPGRSEHRHIAVTRLATGQGTAPHTHDFVELFLVTDGAGVHHWNGRPDPLAVGDLVFVQASDRHWFTAGENLPLRFINLALAPSWWRVFAKLPGVALERHQPRARLTDATFVQARSSLEAMLAGDVTDPLALVATVSGLLRGLHTPTAAPGSAQPRRQAPEWLQRVAQDMQGAGLLDRPIAFWQKRCGRSPEHFARACRNCFGVPPTELLNRSRIQRVKARLRGGEDKIAAIALECGYNNLGYFYRVFRRLEGVSPRAWIRSQGDTATVPR